MQLPVVSLLSIFLSFWPESSAQDGLPLTQCARVHACKATVESYPRLEEESSGWGSGEVPLYDELLSPLTSFDYSAVPETTDYELCACPNNGTCESENEDRNIHLDKSMKLTFCEDVTTQIQQECKGKRGLVRVIGTAHPSGELLSTVSQSLVFCNCPGGFKRDSVEMWGGAEMALQYKCL